MSNELLHTAINTAGLSKAFEVIDTDEFLQQIDQAGADRVLADGYFHRFLEAIVLPHMMPATWQKLADFDWTDDEISGLVDGGVIVEAPTTLIASINLGALAKSEYNEFVNYPNQEVRIFYFAKPAYQIISWLQNTITLPKIHKEAFSE